MTSTPRAATNAPTSSRTSLPNSWAPAPAPINAATTTTSAASSTPYGARSQATVAPVAQPDTGPARGGGYERPMGMYDNTPQPQPAHDDQPASYAPRIARLSVASLDPWSVLKMAFLLSVAAGMALVVSLVVLWSVLKGIGVFDKLNDLFASIGGLDTGAVKFNIYDYIGLSRVLSVGIIIAVVNVLLITALSTVSAFLYNLSAGLVGGIRVTLSDD